MLSMGNSRSVAATLEPSQFPYIQPGLRRSEPARSSTVFLDLWKANAQFLKASVGPLVDWIENSEVGGTSPIAWDHPSRFITEIDMVGTAQQATVEATAMAVASFQEFASLASTTLGLSKSELARGVFNISRPAFYAWLNGSNEPQGENATRLRFLGSIAHELSREVKRPLYHRFVSEPMPEEVTSILDLLKATPWQEDRLRALFIKAKEFTLQREERMGDLGISESRGEDTATDNLLSLGLD